MDKILFTTQYNTKPAGKKKNITENTIGIIFIIFACIGSGYGWYYVLTKIGRAHV